MLPVGVFLSYQAYTSHEISFKAQEMGDYYKPDYADTDKDSVRLDSVGSEYPKEAKTYFLLRDEYESKRNYYAFASAMLLFFPMITLVIAKIYLFTMYGPEIINKSFVKWLKYASCSALAVFAIVVLYFFVVKKKEETPAQGSKQDIEKIYDKYTSQFNKEDNAKKKKTPSQ